MKLGANDLLKLGVIEDIIKEPSGGAHRDHGQAAAILKDRLIRELDSLPPEQLVEERIRK